MPASNNLIAGYQRFREDYYIKNRDHLLKLAEEGQSPKVAIVSCCDSRVDPTVILDCEPGDLFVIRNVANLVPPCENNDSYHGTSAALEFAVTGLEVDTIVILGHTQCGGIQALMDQPSAEQAPSFIAKWMQQADSVRNKILNDKTLTTNQARCDACEQHSIFQSLENLMSFPWVEERVKNGTLHLHGWYYDLVSAKLFAANSDKKVFQDIA